ncbi:MAG: DUF6917 domain-containing protein [Chloroflexota bacterium]
MSGPAVFGQPYSASADVVGRIVTVLQGTSDRRGLYLQDDLRSRAVRAGDIHELMLTDTEVDLGDTVNRVGLIAFFLVEEPGVLIVGSRVQAGDQMIGTLAGFDETHMPNHQNICVQGSDLVDGRGLNLRLGDEVRFEFGVST